MSCPWDPALPSVSTGVEAAETSAPGSKLLIDELLPTYDVGVAHAAVFAARPARCFAAATELDLFQAPVVRALVGIRGWPQRVASILRRERTPALPGSPRLVFRVRDMVDVGWIVLAEAPGSQLVLGQVGHPWRGIAVSTEAPTTPEQFASFEEPGFARIATSIRVDPYGPRSSILTVETRVALTDETSRRRFRHYWLVIGPFSTLIRRMVLRLLAKELRQSPGRD